MSAAALCERRTFPFRTSCNTPNIELASTTLLFSNPLTPTQTLPLPKQTAIHNMSAPVDAPKPVEVPEVGTAGTVEPAPAPVVATEPVVAAPVVEEAPKTEEVPKTEGEAAAAAPVEEVKEEKVVEPIYSGALGYKAPGLKK